MAKLLLVLFALCVVPSIVAGALERPMLLTGEVYCDTCNVGYQTTASVPLADALVEVQCRKRDATSELTFVKQARTNYEGKYHVLVEGDYQGDVCDSVLVESSTPGCGTINRGRERSRVILTRNNGMATDMRYANALGFLTDAPLPTCSKILKQYQETETED